MISFVISLYRLRNLGLSLLVLALTLGIYFMIFGLIELFMAFGHRELPNRGWVTGSGILKPSPDLAPRRSPPPPRLFVGVTLVDRLSDPATQHN